MALDMSCRLSVNTVLIDEKYKFGLLLYSVLVLKRNSAVRTKLEIQGK